MICKAIKAKYPNMIVVGTVGPFHDPSADYVEGWKFAKEHNDILDLVDEHYYESPGWFMHHQDYYDHYDRNAPKVYLGEYASRTRTVESALVEAMYLCGLERNGDVVSMTSYAPLLCKDGYSNWNPDMIYFNNDTITCLTPSYHTQRLWGTHSGDVYVGSKMSVRPELSHRVAASVVRDSKTGKTIVKLVNALPASLSVSLQGLAIPTGAKVEGFAGKPFERTVVETTGVEVGPKVELEPYSVKVITF